MQRFTIPVGYRQEDIPRYLSPFLKIVGYQNLKQRVEAFHKRMEADYFAEHLISRRHLLELTLWRVISRYRKYGKLPSLFTPHGGFDHSILRAYSFITMLIQIHENLTPPAQRRLSGRIKHAFNDENDFSSLWQEIFVFGNLMQFECEIACNDLEMGGGFDFLVTREGVEFEVECKSISNDKGRQIHQYDTLVLIERLRPLIDGYAPHAIGKGEILSIRIPKRLSRDPVILDDIARVVRESVAMQTGIKAAHCETMHLTFDLDSSPFSGLEPRDDEKIKKFIEGKTGHGNGHNIMSISPGRAALIISIESLKSDSVAEYTYAALKEASAQFSGDRPGLIMASFPTLPNEELVSIARDQTGNSLQIIVGRLFENAKRQHVFGVNFFAEPYYAFTPDGHLGMKGEVYRFINDNNPQKTNPSLIMEENQITQRRH